MTTPDSNQAVPGSQGTASPLSGPASFQLDPARSSVSFRHKHQWGLATMRGSFSELSGSAEIQPDGSARGRLEISAASLGTRNRQRDKQLRSADFFSVADHPTIIVDITGATLAGADQVAATGTLTVNGQTRPLSVTAQVTEATHEAITLTATAEIDRADFGMTWNFLGIIRGIAQVSVVARFLRQATAP